MLGWIFTPSINFKTTKTVSIRDWRLGIIHKICVAAIILYYAVWRLGYKGDHLEAIPMNTLANAVVEDNYSDNQFKFEPKPLCDAGTDTAAKSLSPKDLIYQLLPASDMFITESAGRYFIPTRTWAATRSADKMLRTHSEGYSAAVCTAACSMTNLTSNSNSSLRRCRQLQTELDCNSSFQASNHGTLMRQCIWEASACSASPYFATCPGPPCGSGCNPCATFCALNFVGGCAESNDETSCFATYTVSDDYYAVRCAWSNGECGWNWASRTACRDLRAGRRQLCEETPLTPPAGTCSIYESPVDYQPVEVKYGKLSQRVIANPERLTVRFTHVVFPPDGVHQRGNMHGFTIPRKFSDNSGEIQDLFKGWEQVDEKPCVQGEHNTHIVNWTRDGRIQRCFAADLHAQAVDFIPVSTLLDLAGVTTDCDKVSDDLQYASPLKGFTLVVSIEYSNRKPWSTFGSSAWWSTYRVEHLTWMGERQDLPLARKKKYLGGDIIYAKGIRILVRTYGTAYRYSRTNLVALIPEFFAFLAILDALFVCGIIWHVKLSRWLRCGTRASRLASSWYYMYIVERTPDIAKVMKLIRRVYKDECKTVVLTSDGRTGWAGIELNEMACITYIDKNGLVYNLIQNWNEEHPLMAIGLGDKVVSVNSKTATQEMQEEFASEQAYVIEFKHSLDYPAVLSKAAMKQLTDHAHEQSAFDTSFRSVLTAFEVKEQLARFTNMAIKQLNLNREAVMKLAGRQFTLAEQSSTWGRDAGDVSLKIPNRSDTLELGSRVEDIFQSKEIPSVSVKLPVLYDRLSLAEIEINHVRAELASISLDAKSCAIYGHSEGPSRAFAVGTLRTLRTHGETGTTFDGDRIANDEINLNARLVHIEGALQRLGGQVAALRGEDESNIISINDRITNDHTNFNARFLQIEGFVERLDRQVARLSGFGADENIDVTSLSKRILKLERLIGHFHEPEAEEHHALEFDVRLRDSLNIGAQAKDHAEHLARLLNCDHVELTSSKGNILSVLAIGFADLDGAIAKLSNTEARSARLEHYEVVSGVEHQTRLHKASYWLQLQRQILALEESMSLRLQELHLQTQPEGSLLSSSLRVV